MEVMNRNERDSHKAPLLPAPKNAFEREQRLATVWMTFILDAGFTLNSKWSGSMDLDEIYCNLPAHFEQFKSNVNALLQAELIVRPQIIPEIHRPLRVPMSSHSRPRALYSKLTPVTLSPIRSCSPSKVRASHGPC
jgi:hypothetical protein